MIIYKVYIKLKQKVHSLRRRLEAIWRNLFGLVQSDDELIDESRDYWNSTPSRRLKSHSHWREGYAFDSPGVWERLGQFHRDLLLRAADDAGLARPQRIVDWGCGGGMNAVQLAADAKTYFGVDVSKQSLDECERQVSLLDISSFQPVLIDPADPEACSEYIREPCDAFICTYVFELLPTREYGWRIVRLAHSLLQPGGVALIHIRYSTNPFHQSRPWRYAKNLARNTTYRLAEFRHGATEIGFEHLFEEVLRRQDDLNERRYAFFALRRR